MRNTWLIFLLVFLLAACRIPDEVFTTGGGNPGDGSAASDPAPPRLIAPLSMSAVSLQKPTLHWTLGAGGGTPIVDLCKDRLCTVPLSVTTQLADNHLSAVPVVA